MTTHWKFWRIFLFSCIDCSSFCILILLIRNFIFILPTVFMCKTTSNPYCQKYYYMFPTHTCGENTLQKRALTWSVSIQIHSFPWHVCTHKTLTQQQVSRSTLQYFIYTTQYSTQYMNERYQITTSFRKGIIRGHKVTSQSLKKGLWRGIPQLRSTLNS